MTEVELRKVAVQMALIAVLVSATHTALEDAEVGLDSVGVNVGAELDVFFGAVGNIPLTKPAN